MGIFCPTIEDNADPRASFPLQLAVQMGKIVLIIVGYGFREKKYESLCEMELKSE